VRSLRRARLDESSHSIDAICSTVRAES